MTVAFPVPTEAQEAKVLTAWLRVHKLPFAHIPNETGSSPEARRRAIRMKQQGTAKGFPDYVIFINSGILFIELKRQRGSRTTPEQTAWIELINRTPGAAGVVAKGALDAITFIKNYS